MSLSSRAYRLLCEQYHIVASRMKRLDWLRWQPTPGLSSRGRASNRWQAPEPLEPRVLLTAAIAPVDPIYEGQGITLDASPSTPGPASEPITGYAWDLDNDGAYDDGTGETATVVWSTLEAIGINDDGQYPVGLQVTYEGGATDTTTADVQVLNTAPVAQVIGDTMALAGDVYTLTFSATDPGDDTITSLIIDWGDGQTSSGATGDADPWGPDVTYDSQTGEWTATHNYAAAGDYGVTVDFADEDGTHQASVATVEARINLARRTGGIESVATQSSIDGNNEAPRGIDGATGAGHYSTTNRNDSYSWWHLDLGELCHIDRLHFAQPDNANRLSNAWILISDTAFPEPEDRGDADGLALSRGQALWEAQLPNSPTTQALTFDPDATGRYVLVQLINKHCAGYGYLEINELSVLGTPHFPQAVGDSYLASEDTSLAVDVASGLLANDQRNDPGDTLTVTAVDTTGTQGAVTWAADGSFTYDPNGLFEHLAAGESATDSFSYTVEDQNYESSTGTVEITITGANDAPVVAAGSFILSEDAINGDAVGAVDASDVDVSNTLSYAITAGNASGAFAINAQTGQITLADATQLDYAATPLYTLTVQASDGTTSSTGTVQVHVRPNLAQPRAGVTIVATQSTTDGGQEAPRGIDGATGAGHYSTTNRNDSYNWWHLDLGELCHIDRLHFAQPDNANRLSNAWILISDTAFPEPEDRGDADGLALSRGQALWEAQLPNSPTTQALTFDPDVRGQYVLVQLIDKHCAGYGYLEINELSVLGTTNQAPVAAGDTYSVDEDMPLTVSAAQGVLANDTDADPGDTLTAQIVTDPSHAATFTLNPDGSFDYHPADSFHGDDSFTYRAFDGTTHSDPVTVSLTVSPVNDAPTVQAPATAQTDEDNPIVFSAANANAITVDDIDVGDGELALELSATNGLMTLANTTGLTFTAGDGVDDALVIFTGTEAEINTALDGLIFMPTADFHGVATLSVSVNDLGNSGSGAELVASGSVAITVNPINDAPQVTTNQPLQVSEGESDAIITSPVLLAATDLEQSATELTYTVTVAPAHGELKLNGAGLVINSTFTQAQLEANQLTYTHDGGESTGDGFDFTVSDGVASTNGTFTISISPVNDDPTVVISGPTGAGPWAEGHVLSFTSTVTDPDDVSHTYAWTVLKDSAQYTPDGPTDLATFDFTPSDGGTYQVSLTVADSGGVPITSDSITLAVQNHNTWTGSGGDGVWSNPLNWSDDAAPSSTDVVVIPTGQSLAIEADLTVAGLIIEGTLTHTNGILDLQGGSVSGTGTLAMQSGTLANATLSTTTATLSDNYTWQGVTLDTDITIPNGVQLTANGDLTLANNATVTIGDTGITADAELNFHGDILGSGTIAMTVNETTHKSCLTAHGTTDALLDAGVTIQGVGEISWGQRAATVSGSIVSHAGTGGTVLTLHADHFILTQTGLLKATDGSQLNAPIGQESSPKNYGEIVADGPGAVMSLHMHINEGHIHVLGGGKLELRAADAGIANREGA
jgi:VCBS repeat-containing protein